MIDPPKPPYICPSGNCTWDLFPTLGVSVQCFDQSYNIRANCSSPPWIIPELGTLPANYAVCFMEDVFPGRFWKEQDPMLDPNPRKQIHRFLNVFEVCRGYTNISSHYLTNTSLFYYGYPDPKPTLSFPQEGTSIAWKRARDLQTYSDPRMLPSTIVLSSRFDVGRCVFYVSMQVIQAEVFNGVYTETINKSTIQTYPPYNTGSLLFTYQPSYQDTQNRDICLDLPINLTMDSTSWMDLERVLTDILGSGNLSTSDAGTFVARPNGKTSEIKHLYQPDNITATMHTIAHNMTVALRANNTIGQELNAGTFTNKGFRNMVGSTYQVIGTEYVQAVHLRVRWAWLSFPAALVLVVAAIQFHTICASRLKAVGVWKSNSLALPSNTRRRSDRNMLGASTTKQLDKVTENLEARIVCADNGREEEGLEGMIVVRKRMKEM
jgi:hypothetical protein